MLDSTTIRKEVAKEIRARLASDWLEQDGNKLLIKSAENRTKLTIEISILTENRHGGHQIDAYVIIRWKQFARVFKDFINWYNVRYKRFAKNHSEFATASFNGIDGNFLAKSRGPFWVANEQDLDMFIAQCVNDLGGRVGEWIKNWFTWPSALAAMDDNEDLCGSWRTTAYFCLLDQVHGREAACAWIDGFDSTNWPELLAAQVEYLRSHICRDA